MRVNNLMYDIPKNLIFIWTDEKVSGHAKKPAYYDTCVNSFRELNPDYNIIELDDNSEIAEECRIFFKTENDTFLPANLFQEYLRLYSLFKYGGIYLDCDCFAVKPFDDNILKYDYILAPGDFYAIASVKRDVHTISYDAFYHFGENPGRFHSLTALPDYFEPKNENDLRKMKLKQKFFDGTIKIGDRLMLEDRDMYYFDHYNAGSWKDGSKVNYCQNKYDVSRFKEL